MWSDYGAISKCLVGVVLWADLKLHCPIDHNEDPHLAIYFWVLHRLAVDRADME